VSAVHRNNQKVPSDRSLGVGRENGILGGLDDTVAFGLSVDVNLVLRALGHLHILQRVSSCPPALTTVPSAIAASRESKNRPESAKSGQGAGDRGGRHQPPEGRGRQLLAQSAHRRSSEKAGSGPKEQKVRGLEGQKVGVEGDKTVRPSQLLTFRLRGAFFRADGPQPQRFFPYK